LQAVATNPNPAIGNYFLIKKYLALVFVVSFRCEAEFSPNHRRGEDMINKNVLPFKMEISNELLTPRAGLILAHEFHLGLKIDRLIDNHLPVPGSGRGHKPSDFVMPLILTLQGGGTNLDDIKVIAEDKALRNAAQIRHVPASCTFGDWLRRTGASRKAMKGLSESRKELTRVMLSRGKTTEFTLDADTTIIEADKGDATEAYEGTVGYQPIIGFLFENKWIISEEFRTGSASPAGGMKEFIKNCEVQMPEGTRIARFRSDSAAYNHEVSDYCDENHIEYVIGADKDAAVQMLYESIPSHAWVRYIAPNSRKEREVAETVHSFNKGKGSFRIIFVRDVEAQGELFSECLRRRAVITNIPMEKMNAADVVNCYNQRGTAENFIKELKYGVGMRSVPCGQFEANAAFFRIGTIAYDLFLMQMAFGFPPELSAATVGTIRWRIYQTAGRLVRHARNFILRVAADAATFAAMLKARSASLELFVT